MTNQFDEGAASQTDEGVPVGAADARADEERASGEDRPEPDRDDYLEQSAADETTDQGVPVGAADAEQDRLNASGDEGSST